MSSSHYTALTGQFVLFELLVRAIRSTQKQECSRLFADQSRVKSTSGDQEVLWCEVIRYLAI